MQEAREDPGRSDREASETFSRSRYTAFSSRRRRKEAFTKGPNEVATEFKDVGAPACTRERERAQTADRVVVKYLDRKARAPTANRRSRSGVGGARRGVREYGAVDYHKVEVKEPKNETVQQTRQRGSSF